MAVQSLGIQAPQPLNTLDIKQAEGFEEQTGKTIGELALLGIEADVPPEEKNATAG